MRFINRLFGWVKDETTNFITVCDNVLNGYRHFTPQGVVTNEYEAMVE
jgi:hypothetical protein